MMTFLLKLNEAASNYWRKIVKKNLHDEIFLTVYTKYKCCFTLHKTCYWKSKEIDIQDWSLIFSQKIFIPFTFLIHSITYPYSDDKQNVFVTLPNNNSSSYPTPKVREWPSEHLQRKNVRSIPGKNPHPNLNNFKPNQLGWGFE